MRESFRRVLSARPARVGHRPFTLGWAQFIVVAAGIVLVFTFIAVALAFQWPALYAQMAIKRFERPFGFEAGDVVRRYDNRQWSVWGVTAVVPDGELDRAGVRVGDAPFERHGGGAVAFYDALAQAAAGGTGRFDVVNAADYSHGGLRTIVVPPLKR